MSSRSTELLLAALSGVLYFVSFVGFGVFPLTWVCFVPLLWAIRQTTPRRALLLGTVFGLVTNMGGYYWVVQLIEQFADLALPLAFLGYVLLCLYQGFLLACVTYLVRRAGDLGVAPVWSLPVAFVAMEFVYPLLFPSYIGNAQYKFSAITQIVDVTGMLGLTALIGLVNGAVFEILVARKETRVLVRRRLWAPALFVAIVLAYGLVRIHLVDESAAAARSMRVALVQTNLGAREKAEKSAEFIRRHREMTLEVLRKDPSIELVVWPESAYNKWIPRSERNLARAVTGGITTPLIFGALTYDKEVKGQPIYNTAVLTSSTGAVLQLYDKIELLAFGETLPLLGMFPSLQKLTPSSRYFTRGTALTHFDVGKARLLPMICYEDILPDLVRRIWRQAGPADALVNITNDSWYGDTHEPLIHLVLASFRSIETRRALIRSTNTGISGFVDPVGRITSRTGQWTQENLVADVPVISDGSQTIYMIVGDVLGWLSVVALGWGIWRLRALRPRPSKR